MDKILKITGFALCGIIIISTILYLTRIMENADNIFMPCLAALMFVVGLENFKKSKPAAIICLIVGTFMLILVAFHFIGML